VAVTLTMKRAFIQIATFLVLLFFVMLVRFPYHEYGVKLFDSLRETLRSQGILLEAKDIQFAFPAQVRFDEISLLLPHRKIPIPLHASKAELDPDFLSLLFLNGVLQSNIQAYDGSLDSKLTYSLFGGSAAVELNGERLRLEQHPLMSANGVSGLLRLKGNADLESVEGRSEKSPVMKIRRGKLFVQLEDGAYQGTYKVAGLVPIPKLTDVRSELILNNTEAATEIEKFDFFSSLGQMSASGELKPQNDNEGFEIKLTGSISLTAEGEKTVGAYLALAAGLSPDRSQRNWSFTFSQNGQNGAPIFKAVPL